MVIRKDRNWFDRCPRCESIDIGPNTQFCKRCGIDLAEITRAVHVLINKGVTPEDYRRSYEKSLDKS